MPADSDSAPWRNRPRLIDILPCGEDQAVAEVERLFDLAGREPTVDPQLLASLKGWLASSIRSEYRFKQRHQD